MVTFRHTLLYHDDKPTHHSSSCNETNLPTTFTASLGLLFGPVGTFSILRSVSIPSITFPNTTCLPSKKSHFAVVMKNWIWMRSKVSRFQGCVPAWQPLVFAPEFACTEWTISHCEQRVNQFLTIERRPGPVCFSWKFSSWSGDEHDSHSTGGQWPRDVLEIYLHILRRTLCRHPSRNLLLVIRSVA